MARPRSNPPSPIDVHVGNRMRMRRMMLGWSQGKLAEKFSFQQVQKYEKGANRMGSSRLQQAADIFGVAVPFFFEGATGGHYEPDGSTPSPHQLRRPTARESVYCACGRPCNDALSRS